MNMKNFLILLCAICWFPIYGNGQVTKELVLHFNENNFTYDKDDAGQLMISSLTHPVTYSGDTQLPALPLIRINYLIGADESYKGISIETEGELISTGVVIAPNPKIVPTDKIVLSNMDYPKASYKDITYPLQCIEYTGTHLMGGFKYLTFLVCPFTYDASAKNLYLKKEMTLNIETTQTSSGLDRQSNASYKDISMLPTLRNLVVNNEDIDRLYEFPDVLRTGDRSANSYSADYECLIITSNALSSAFQPLADWKTVKGIRSKVLTTEEISSHYSPDSTLDIQIKSALKDYYDGTYSGLKYVLLGGDVNIVPSRMCQIVYDDGDSICYDSTPTDLFYACFDGAFNWNRNGNDVYGELDDSVDLSPEIVVTRVPVNTSSEVSSFVNRIINYERNPLATNWQKNYLVGGHMLSLWDLNGNCDAETKSDIFYAQYIQPYWNCDRTKVFNTYSGNHAWTFNPSSLQGKLEEGFSFADILTHGMPTFWQMRGSNRYRTDEAQNLVNTGRTIITTIACLTNAFDENVCLSEAFIRNSNSGILGYLGCSRDGLACWWITMLGPSFEYNGEFYKGLFTNAHKKFGQTIFDAKSLFIGSCYNYKTAYRWLMFGLNPIGDPEMPVYIDTPRYFENLRIAFANGTLNVSTGLSDCTICVSGTSYYEVSTGTTASFSNVADGYNLCVTKPGYIPFVATIRDSEYLQNTTLTGNNYIVAKDVYAGRDVTTAMPQGNVTISDGNTAICGTNSVTLKNNVTVQPGATLKITMGNQ